MRTPRRRSASGVSVLFNEPKLLKFPGVALSIATRQRVSVLFNEPKLLKSVAHQPTTGLQQRRFSALQRAEIAEIESYPLLAIIPSPMFQCSSTSRNC